MESTVNGNKQINKVMINMISVNESKQNGQLNIVLTTELWHCHSERSRRAIMTLPTLISTLRRNLRFQLTNFNIMPHQTRLHTVQI